MGCKLNREILKGTVMIIHTKRIRNVETDFPRELFSSLTYSMNNEHSINNERVERPC